MLIIAAVLAVALLKLLGPTPVTAVHPQRAPLVAEVFGTGTLEAKVVVSFSAKMVDKVGEVLVDQGDTVTEGQVLARLEATDYEHSVRVADAGVGQAQAELAKARLDIARQREMLRSAIISHSEFDSSEAAYRVAEAKLKNAEAQLGFARARLADTVIYSPVSGLVMTRNLEVGGTVVPGAPIFRIADTHQLWITAMVDELVAGTLRVGQPARVTFRAHPGKSFPGRLARLAEEADRVTEEREADVTVEQLPPDWFIGAKADVYIETDRPNSAARTIAGPITYRMVHLRVGERPCALCAGSNRGVNPEYEAENVGSTNADSMRAFHQPVEGISRRRPRSRITRTLPYWLRLLGHQQTEKLPLHGCAPARLHARVWAMLSSLPSRAGKGRGSPRPAGACDGGTWNSTSTEPQHPMRQKTTSRGPSRRERTARPGRSP